MRYKINRIVSVLCLLAALLSVALFPVSGYGENLRFVFLGDSRSGDPTVPNPTPTDLINTPVLNAINAQILALSPRPSFVVYGGDQAYRGCYNGTYNFQAFKDLFEPLTSVGITLYTAVGNHELYNQDTEKFYLANQQQYQQVFTDNLSNGPTAAYDRLVYSFESLGGDAFFAVLDPYYLTADVLDPELTGTFDKAQRDWLKDKLAKTKATHKFLFTHAPYYYVTTAEGDNPPDNTYTRLWSLLDNNRFDLYCCGHSHLFSRKTIDSSILPNPQLLIPVQWHHNVVQVINGGAGAPVETNPPYPPIHDPTLWHIGQAADTYYFSVVDISGNKVTVTSYSGNTGAYSVFDTFTINKNAVPATNFLLLD